MRRLFKAAIIARPTPRPVKTMEIVRLGQVLLPDAAVVVPRDDLPTWPSGPPSKPIAAFGPGNVGVEATVRMTDDGGAVVIGGCRVRLLKERPSHDRSSSIGTMQRLVDVAITPARAARLVDEASRARELTALAVEQSHLERHEGFASVQKAADLLDAPKLSLFLAGRLPLTPRLLAEFIACSCPLGRMKDVVDAMRLLTEPSPRRSRPGHRFQLRESPSGSGALIVDKNVAVV